VGAVTNRPAASWKDQPAGTGSSEPSFTQILVAKEPWPAPKTRSPARNRSGPLLGFLGAEMTVPANSAPATHGKAAHQRGPFVSNSTIGFYKGDGRGTMEGGVQKQRTWLVLVFALHLENVKEVGGRRVHPDEVLIVLGHGVWQVGDLELARAL
jgi:hypothetical protein